MGKNSLLKPTSKKKKSPSKKKDEEMTTKAKKTTPKTKAAPKAKKAAAKAKPKAAPKAKKAVAKAKPKAKAAPKAKKAAAKTKAAPKAKPKAKVAPQKKLSLKEIMQKKFDSWKPEKPFTVSPDEVQPKYFSAPPFFSDLTAEETRRIKKLLFKKFDIQEIKAAGEKAAAEKAAAEKAAAEKAAAEKAAAEKAAAEKAAEEEVSVSYDPPADVDTTIDDPLEKGMKYAVAVFVVLIALIIGTSAMNTNNFYVKSSDGALEIWQGKFAPMGEELLIMLPGVQAPEIKKDVYSKTDVFPLIFNYYIEKADTLLEVPGMPDFEGIRSYLNKALNYSTSKEISQAVFTRLDNIDMMILMYKADVAASKGTVEELENAKAYLAEAAKLNIDDLQANLIDQKIETIDKLLIDLEVEATKAAEAAEAAPSAE